MILRQISAVTGENRKLKINMFYYFVLDRLIEGDFNSVISLKQRTMCRHVTHFDTNTYVINQD